jgi:hypothetical protein
MNLPSKSIPYSRSILPKFAIVLREFTRRGVSPLALYGLVKDELHDVAEFVEVLDCLFLLGKIDFNKEQGVLIRVS